MKVWRCLDNVVFLNRRDAAEYSVDLGLTVTKAEAERVVRYHTLTNDDRFAPMGKWGGELIFKLVTLRGG